MILSVQLILVAAAFVLTILHSMGKVPLWPAVLIVTVALFLMVGAGGVGALR
jgi:hypothetical protein